MTKRQSNNDPELQLIEDIASFYADPFGFVKYAFPWGQPGTPLEKHEGPDEWHRELFDAMAAQIIKNLEHKEAGEDQEPFRAAVASGHGIGKSACVAWVILWLMSTRKDCRGIVTANTENQLNTKTWPELAKWHAMAINKHWFEWTATRFSYALYPESRRKNYCFDAVPWSENRSEAFAGLHNESSAVAYIFDEASAIPNKISEVASGGLTDGEPWWFKFGNPTRNSGDFYDCFHKNRKYWWRKNVDSRSVRITNKKYLNEMIDQWGEDSYEARVRIRGLFPTESALQFIGTQSVENAVARDLVKDPGAPLVMAIDPARFGDDKTAFFFRKGNDARSIPPRRFEKMDTMGTAQKAMEFIEIYNPDYVIVDGGGVGGGVVDRLRQLGIRVIEVNFGSSADDKKRYFNKRAEIWGRMKEAIQSALCLCDDQDLQSDLTSPEYGFTASQQIKLERKEDMKKRGLPSPDNADALALTYAVRTAHKDLASAKSRKRRRAVADGVGESAFT